MFARFSAVLLSVVLVLAFGAADARGKSGDWGWPVRGQVITQYANDNTRPYSSGMHRGIDIAARVGTRVVAAHEGLVTFAGALGSAGLTVAVRSGDGYATSYLHLSRIAVTPGARVGMGERVGAVGTTGERSAAEPHLHFGVRIARRAHFYVDPLSLLPPLVAGRANAAPTPVPAGAPARAQEAPVRHPVAGRLPVLEPAPAPGWGRTLGLAGVALLLFALFGAAVLRRLRNANGALGEWLHGRIAGGLRAILRAPVVWPPRIRRHAR